MSSTSTRVKLGDIWPGPWPPLGTAPGIPNTNHPTVIGGYNAYKRWQQWRDGERPGRWYGRHVSIIWDSRGPWMYHEGKVLCPNPR